MARRTHQHGSNLFKIDLDTVLKTIKDVNKDLLINTDKLLNELENLPKNLSNDIELKVVQDFIVKLSQHKKEVAQSRLSDSKPFSEATKKIKNWYGAIEDKLKIVENNLSNIVNLYVNKQFQEESTVEKDNTNQENGVVGLDYSGEPIVSINNNQTSYIEKKSILYNLKTTWEIESFDRDEVPIEELRQYFSDYSIKLALSKHMTKNGPNKLAGVKYARTLDKHAKINLPE